MSSEPSAVIGADGHHTPASNPHVLWKNVLANVIAGLAVFLVAFPFGLLAILAGHVPSFEDINPVHGST